PTALQEIRHSLPGVKRFPEAPLEIVLPGGQGEGRRTVTHPYQPRDNPAASVALSNLPIGPHYLTDHIQPVARHMARPFRSPGVFQAATIGLACVMLLSSPHAAVTQRRTGAIAGRLVDHESHSPIRGAHIALLGPPR